MNLGNETQAESDLRAEGSSEESESIFFFER